MVLVANSMMLAPVVSTTVHVSYWGRSVHAADDQGKRGAAGGDERGALYEIAAAIRHRERVLDRKMANRRRVFVAMRIGGEVSGHVLDQFARVGADRGGEQHRREIRSAASERGDRSTRADAEETRDDDDARSAQGRQ